MKSEREVNVDGVKHLELGVDGPEPPIQAAQLMIGFETKHIINTSRAVRC
jgi:hypothetical protein